MEPGPKPLAWPRRLSHLLERAWASGLADRPMLECGALIDAAARREGARPAPGDWQPRLESLSAALNHEARLNALGQTIAFGQLVRILASRVRAERLIACDPAIARRTIPPPVVIVGQMRSGTTRLHRLLACDPAFRHTRLFETLEPVPRGPRLDRRPAAALVAMKIVRLCNPACATIHPSWPFAPEEEFGLHAFSIWGAQFEGQWSVPGFVAANEATSDPDKASVYADFRMLLQLRDTQDGRVPLLKAPQFCTDLNALLAEFPDASIIRLKRSPDRIVASGASLAWNQMRIQSDHADRAAIGSEWLRKTALREQCLRSVLDSGLDHIAIDYDDVSADWRAAIHRIYAFLGRSLDPAVEAKMARLMAKSTAHRGHRYRLEDFGLDKGLVEAALA